MRDRVWRLTRKGLYLRQRVHGIVEGILSCAYVEAEKDENEEEDDDGLRA